VHCRAYERGFTLLEVMVAFGVFALAGLVWFKVIASSSHLQQELETRQMALWTAHNQLVLVMSGLSREVAGAQNQGDHQFRWSLEYQDTDTPGMGRFDVRVSGGAPDVDVVLTGFGHAR